MNEETIKCPYCAEDILRDAKKCKHCGEFLNAGISKTTSSERKKLSGGNVLMYTIAGVIILAVLMLIISSLLDY